MFFDRSMLEKAEEHVLAPYGMHSQASKGRLQQEKEPDYRTCFQRDRDRILHTTAFRRLEYKTQVFINFEGDYYRTRLTHTLEVAQIGRTIARALGANEDLVEAICLAHDLGHPPFGHAGERILTELMKDHGGFDHNKQSFRLVTKLEQRFKDFDGLNLSWEVLEGMVKHETEYDRSDAIQFDPDLRGHLEAQITNVADELAYTSHDLDDGLHSEMISPDMLSGIELWEILLDEANFRNCFIDELKRHELIRNLIGILVTDQILATTQRLQESRVTSVDELQHLSHNITGYSEDTLRRSRQLKDFLFKELYRHFRVVRMEVKACRVITELFTAYRTEPNILPDHIQSKIDQEGLERTICDYLAGMTDRYAIDEYNRLFDPNTLP
jgi:dGTPase